MSVPKRTDIWLFIICVLESIHVPVQVVISPFTLLTIYIAGLSFIGKQLKRCNLGRNHREIQNKTHTTQGRRLLGQKLLLHKPCLLCCNLAYTKAEE